MRCVRHVQLVMLTCAAEIVSVLQLYNGVLLLRLHSQTESSFILSPVVNDQPDDHVKRIAEFAVDAIAAASTCKIDEDDPNSKYVEIRVGFHSGPVVADVVGTRNPRQGGKACAVCFL